MLDQFNLLDFDSRRATLSAMSILSILLLLCCLNKWVLYSFTAFFTLFALFLCYKQFIEPKLSKKNAKV